MPFIIDVGKIQQTPEAYNGPWGTQCVALVQMASAAAGSSNPPNSKLWRQGIHVREAAAGAIVKGTVIATFIDGTYPTIDPRHAAVYLSHDDKCIRVIDQWVGQPTPKETRPLTYRDLPTDRPLGLKDVDNGELYFVVELTAAPVETSPIIPRQSTAK
jgi:hypothetical protein